MSYGSEHYGHLSPGRHLYRPDSQGREARRPAGPAGHQSRTGHQPQDREGARPHRPAHAARPRRRGDRMRRREFITLLGGAASRGRSRRGRSSRRCRWSGLSSSRSADANARNVAAFRKGLSETGYVEGQNVTIEYHWLEGQYDRLPALVADLVRRQVAVIATPGSMPAALAAKAATATIPIVFGVGEDPVQLGLVASLARPGGNATGINFFVTRWRPSGWDCCTSWCPRPFALPCSSIRPMLRRRDHITGRAGSRRHHRAANPGPQRQHDRRDRCGLCQPCARAPRRPLVAPDAFFTSRRVQFATLAARDRIPAAYADRDFVAAGGLMSYGTDLADMFRQVGVYTGKSSRAPSPPTCRCCNRPNSSSSSTCKRRERSASRCRRGCSRSPTR